jgi:hypothetical protein
MRNIRTIDGSTARELLLPSFGSNDGNLEGDQGNDPFY